MNIAIFASAFHPSLGGVEELCRQLAHELRRRGDHPMILTNRWPKSLPAAEEFEGLPLRRYAFRVPEKSWKQWGGAILFGPATLRRVCADLVSHQADVLHVQCISSNAHYAVAAKERLGLPLVVTLQGELTMDAGGLFQHSEFARDNMRRALAAADAVTACSRQTLAEAEAFLGEPVGSKASVVYNGIRVSDFQNIEPHPHPRPYILAIGRLVPQKGFDVLLRAFARAKIAAGADHDLLLAGDGIEKENLKSQAQDLGLADRVHFLGKVDRPTAARLFVGCSFFVLPSRHEPMGIVNLEAMAAGKAVIASAVGGVPELVEHNKTGVLIPGGDVDALTAALEQLTADPMLRDRLGAAGRLRAQDFDWVVLADQYRLIYQRLLARKTHISATEARAVQA